MSQQGILSELGRQAAGYCLSGVEACLPFLNSLETIEDSLWKDAEEVMDVEGLAQDLALNYHLPNLNSKEMFRYLQLTVTFIGNYYFILNKRVKN